MRIAVLVHRFPSISQTFILNQIVGLKERGHEVHIYPEEMGSEDEIHESVKNLNLLETTFYPLSKDPRSTRAQHGIRVIFTVGKLSLPALVKSVLKNKNKLVPTRRLLHQAIPFLRQRHNRYDAVHAHFGNAGVKAVRLRRIGAFEAPILTSFHGYDVNVGAKEELSHKYDQLFSHGEMFTANTNFTASRAASLGCPPERLAKLPEALDPAQYQFYPRKLNEGESTRLLTVGRLVEKKGIEYAIRAAAILKERQYSFEYRIIGEGPLRKSLEQLIHDLGLQDRVKLLGSKTQEQVRDLYSESHLFVLASVTAQNGDMEGQGLVLQEAQASGMPVVSTLHNGIPEGVRDGISGRLVPERDPVSLAGAIEELMDNSEQWAKMGRAGRELVENEFDINKLNDRLVEIYESMSRRKT